MGKDLGMAIIQQEHATVELIMALNINSSNPWGLGRATDHPQRWGCVASFLNN